MSWVFIIQTQICKSKTLNRDRSPNPTSNQKTNLNPIRYNLSSKVCTQVNLIELGQTWSGWSDQIKLIGLFFFPKVYFQLSKPPSSV